MSEIDDGGAAFSRNAYAGMSLREWYAGMALQGLLANPSVILKQTDIPELSFEYADAVIRAGKGGVMLVTCEQHNCVVIFEGKTIGGCPMCQLEDELDLAKEQIENLESAK